MELIIKDITMEGTEEAVWKFVRSLSTLAADASRWDGVSVTWSKVLGSRLVGEPKTLLEVFTKEDGHG
jgi:hypothetical protein